MLEDDHVLRSPTFWQQVLKPIDQFQPASKPKDLNDSLMALPYSEKASRSSPQSSLQANLEVNLDEYKMLQAIVKQILPHIPLDQSGTLPQSHQIGNLVMPLTKTLCDKMLLFPPKSAPLVNTYGAQTWNRLIWYTLSIMASKEKGQTTRQKKRQDDKGATMLNTLESPQPLECGSAMDNSDYEYNQRTPLKRNVAVTHPAGGSSARILKSYNKFRAGPSSPSPFYSKAQSQKAQAGTGGKELVIPAVKLAPPPAVYSSPIISFVYMGENDIPHPLMEFPASELFARDAIDRDIAKVHHAQATAAARRHIPSTSANIMTDYNFDILTLCVPNNPIYNGEQSKDPEDDRFGVLSSIALGENRMLIVFFVDPENVDTGDE